VEPYEIIDTSPVDAAEPATKAKPRHLARLFLGFGLLAVIILACLGTIAYFTLGQIKKKSKNIPPPNWAAV
jgi:hypothetical protein